MSQFRCLDGHDGAARHNTENVEKPDGSYKYTIEKHGITNELNIP